MGRGGAEGFSARPGRGASGSCRRRSRRGPAARSGRGRAHHVRPRSRHQLTLDRLDGFASAQEPRSTFRERAREVNPCRSRNRHELTLDRLDGRRAEYGRRAARTGESTKSFICPDKARRRRAVQPARSRASRLARRRPAEAQSGGRLAEARRDWISARARQAHLLR